MSNLPVNAHIIEIDEGGEGGAFYPVRLHWVPRPGDLIDLYSFLDDKSGHPPQHYYEVVRVVHKLHDIAETVTHTLGGHHFAEIYVRPSQDNLLKK
jgi:hypothetical protein